MTIGNMIKELYDKTCGILNLNATEVGSSSYICTEDCILLIIGNAAGYTSASTNITYNDATLVEETKFSSQSNHSGNPYNNLSSICRIISAKRGLNQMLILYNL